jgi:hypothetical protein
MLFGNFLYQIGHIDGLILGDGTRYPAFNLGRLNLHWPNPATLVGALQRDK